MSGLGIDFRSQHVDSDATWNAIEAFGIRPSSAVSSAGSVAQLKRLHSRWSESTRVSHTLSDHSTSTTGFAADRHGLHFDVAPHPRMLRDDNNDKEHIHEPQLLAGRGSHDSQTSSGPLTPQDATFEPVTTAACDANNFLSTPRRAPAPPAKSEPPVSRRRSFSQSMMKTLSGRRKETNIPTPLTLTPPLPSLPADLAMAPIVHQITLPDGFLKPPRIRGGATLSSPATGKSPAVGRLPSTPKMRKKSTDSSADPKTPRTPSIAAIVRSLRTSLSASPRKTSGASAISMVSKISKQSAPTSPIIRGLSSSASLSPKYTSSSPSGASPNTGLSPKLPRKSGKRPSDPVKPAPRPPRSPPVIRPKTAPSERVTFGAPSINTASPVGTQMSMSLTASPLPDYFTKPTVAFDVDYVNPWSTTYAPETSCVADTPISPGGASLAWMQREESRSEASLYKQSILEREDDVGELVGFTESRPQSMQVPPTRLSQASQMSDFFVMTPSIHASTPARKASVAASTTDPSHAQDTVPQFFKTFGDVSLRNPFAATSRQDNGYAVQDEPAQVRFVSTAHDASLPATPASEVDIVPTLHINNEAPATHSSQPLDEVFAAVVAAPTPGFRNPFLSRKIDSPAGRISSPGTPSSHPSLIFAADPYGQRSSSAAGSSSRRPSYASAGSHPDYPSRPTKLETRRRTESVGVGLRVSIDDGSF